MRFIDGLGNNLIVGGLGASAADHLDNLLLLPKSSEPALQFRREATPFAQVNAEYSGPMNFDHGNGSWQWRAGVNNNSDVRMTLAGGILQVKTLQATGGGQPLTLHPGTADHGYIGFFARTASPMTRSGYFGFPGPSPDISMAWVNEISGGSVILGTSSAYRWKVDGNGHFLPFAAHDIGSSGNRVAKYWGVNGDFSGNLALQGGICASGQISTNYNSGAPLTVVSETMVAHLTAEFLGAGGQNAAYFKDPG